MLLLVLWDRRGVEEKERVAVDQEILQHISFFFFFKHRTAYVIRLGLVGSEMCIRAICCRARRSS